MGGFGFQKVLFFKESATYGSAETLTSGDLIIPVEVGIDVKKEIERITTEHLRGTRFLQQAEDQLGLISIAGSVSGVVPYKSDFGYILKNLLGKVTTTGASAPYTHKYVWNSKLFVGMSIAENAAGATYVHDGCQWASMAFDCNVGGPVKWSGNIIGKHRRILATITPPTYTPLTAHPYIVATHATFKIDTVAEPIIGINWEISNELAAAANQSYSIGDEKRKCLPAIGGALTGTLRRRHDADGTGEGSALQEAFEAGTVATLELTCTHPTDSDYKFILHITVKYNADPGVGSDIGPIIEEVPFIAVDLDNATNNYIEVTDESENPVTATGTYDGSGT